MVASTRALEPGAGRVDADEGAWPVLLPSSSPSPVPSLLGLPASPLAAPLSSSRTSARVLPPSRASALDGLRETAGRVLLVILPRLEVASPPPTPALDFAAPAAFAAASLPLELALPPLASLGVLRPVAMPNCAIRVMRSAFSASFAAFSLCCLLAPSSISKNAWSSMSCTCGRLSCRIRGASLSMP